MIFSLRCSYRIILRNLSVRLFYFRYTYSDYNYNNNTIRGDPRQKLSVNELIDITHRSGTLSVHDTGDAYDVDTPNVESDSETIDNLEIDQ